MGFFSYRWDKMKQSMRNLGFSALVISTLLLVTCEVWGSRDNPVDDGATNYEGVPTVASIAEFALLSPADGGTLSGTTVTVTKVQGAKAYEARIAATASALDTSASLDSTSNSIDISAASLLDATDYCWQARVQGSDGIWGSWSGVRNFKTKWSPAETPIFDPLGGFYTAAQSVTISCTATGASIYYTTDGTTPTTNSTKYTGAITATVSPATTIEAIAMAPYYKQSAVGTATYHQPYTIGETGPAGGMIFYDKGSYSDGWRWLEAAPSDQSTGIQWYNGTYTTTGATATAIGTGEANTQAIVASQDIGSYAAELCADLTLGGYRDWFLPSKDELNLMYVNLKVQGRGGFASAWYWSSSEGNFSYAWAQDFVIVNQFHGNKDDGNGYVRAARAF